MKKRKGLATKPQAIHIATKVTVTEHGPNDTDGATVMVRVGHTVTSQEYTRATGAHNAAKIAADNIGASYVQRIPYN